MRAFHEREARRLREVSDRLGDAKALSKSRWHWEMVAVLDGRLHIYMMEEPEEPRPTPTGINEPFDDCDCETARRREDGSCVLHAPTVQDIAHAITTDVEVAAMASTCRWNNSHEAERLGVLFGYTCNPVIMEITASPRDRPTSTRMFRAHTVTEEVTHVTD